METIPDEVQEIFTKAWNQQGHLNEVQGADTPTSFVGHRSHKPLFTFGRSFGEEFSDVFDLEELLELFLSMGGYQLFMRFVPGMKTANQSNWIGALHARFLKRAAVDCPFGVAAQQAHDIIGPMRFAIGLWKQFRNVLSPSEMVEKIRGSWPFNTAGGYFPKDASHDLRGWPFLVTNINQHPNLWVSPGLLGQRALNGREQDADGYRQTGEQEVRQGFYDSKGCPLVSPVLPHTQVDLATESTKAAQRREKVKAELADFHLNC
jgi:hypothetical protein